MAERPIAPLSPAARDLLRAFAHDESPTAAERDRTWDGVLHKVDHAAPPAATVRGGRYYATVVGATVGLAAAALLVAKVAFVGVTALADDARQPAMEAPYQGGAESEGGRAIEGAPSTLPSPNHRAQRPAQELEAAEVVDTAEVVEAVEDSPPAVTQVPKKLRTRATESVAPAEVTPPSASSLRAELALIKEATAAKSSGEIDVGLAAIRKHEQRFPSGTLVDERRVLKAELLCEGGRRELARAEVRRFLRERGSSASAARMRGVCR